jgi:SOS response regulatory protein OraA/RecX
MDLSLRLMRSKLRILKKKAKDELEARGVTEDELRTKLLEKGIDVDNLKNMDPNQVIQMQAEIENSYSRNTS